MNDTLRSYAKGGLQAQPQNEQQATHCQKITKEQGKICPSNDALAEVYAKYRGYFLRPKVWFTLYEKKVVIESNGAKQVILFDDILEVKYHSGRYAEIRGLRIKANEINIGISCLGDRLNLSEKEDDVEQFDQFFNTFEEKTELFLEENGSEYGRNNECIRLKKIKK